jgi:hypothetical protein
MASKYTNLIESPSRSIHVDITRDFKFVGTNAYWLPYLNSDADIQATLANMSKAGITVVRTWAFNGVNQHPIHLLYFLAILILKSNRRHRNSSNGQLVATYPER